MEATEVRKTTFEECRISLDETRLKQEAAKMKQRADKEMCCNILEETSL